MLLIRLVVAHAPIFLALTTVSALTRVATAAIGKILQLIFDGMGPTAVGGSHLWALVGVVAAMETARVCVQFRFVAARLEPRLRQAAESQLRRNLLRAAMRDPLGHRCGEAALLHAAVGPDTDEIGDLLVVAPVIAGRWAFSVVAVAVMASTSPRVTVLVILPLFLVVVTSRATSARLLRTRYLLQAAQVAAIAAVTDLFSAAPTIKSIGAQQSVLAHVARVDARRLRVQRRENALQAARITLPSSAGLLCNGLLLIVAAVPLSRGSFSVGDLTMFAFYGFVLTDTFSGAGALAARAQRCGLALERMVGLAGSAGEVLARAAEDRGSADLRSAEDGAMVPAIGPGSGGALSAEGLSMHRPGTAATLTDVCFTVPSGSLTVICGTVGCGKSTLLAVLAGLLQPDSGLVRWRGCELPGGGGPGPDFALVPQLPWLFDASVRDNILLGADVSAAILAEALHVAALGPDLRQLEDGLDTPVGSGGVRLSGGQVQRIGLARALVRRPRLLLLDDVTSALDHGTDALVWQRLSRLPGVTIVACTNRESAVTRADQVVLIDDGGCVCAPALAFLASDPRLRGLVGADKAPDKAPDHGHVVGGPS